MNITIMCAGNVCCKKKNYRSYAENIVASGPNPESQIGGNGKCQQQWFGETNAREIKARFLSPPQQQQQLQSKLKTNVGRKKNGADWTPPPAGI